MNEKRDRYKDQDEWRAEAVKRFGDDPMNWKFICPVCGHVASTKDYKEAGAPHGAVAFSCVGRWLPEEARDALGGEGDGPCNYTGGGLIKLNPVTIEDADFKVFDFAPGGEK
jgi:hypothetical protein